MIIGEVIYAGATLGGPQPRGASTWHEECKKQTDWEKITVEDSTIKRCQNGN